ncbi:MAG: glycosyltransferase [Candidatus Aegiribacteria sp.]|nr:glycosyltransferase [Candidatus Aegiribacteria sp.]
MKVCILGPAPPFRGGIVTYLGMLARELKGKGNEVFWSSFKKQYPRFLFPGSNQLGEVAPWIRMENSPRFVPWSPLSWYRTYRDIRKENPVAVLMKYWLPFFALGYAAVAWMLNRNTDIRTIYILDNVIPHEKQPFSRVLGKAALSQGYGFIAQSENVKSDLLSVLPKINKDSIKLIPHPVYDFGEPGVKRKSKSEARKELGLPMDIKVVLFFGFIKPYKGVDYLIDACPILKDRYGNGIRVLIVGDVYGDSTPYYDRISNSGAEDIIDFDNGFVPDSKVEDYFIASDLLALPYLSATQSGIIQIAYNYDLPVVTTEVGGLPEVVHDGETGFLVPPEDSVKLAEAAIRFFDEDFAPRLAEGIAKEKHKYSWNNLASAILDLAAE